ncbi:MAG: hypothetical protein ABJC89_14995 [Acidobacteriota bacterium]
MPSEFEWIKSVRLKFGPPLSLIDLSAGGALVESSAPLRPGAIGALTMTGRTGSVETASFRVLRCQVASLNGGLVYRGACVFDRMIVLPERFLSARDRTPTLAVSAEPTRSDTFSAALTGGSAELTEVLTLIRAAAARPVEASDGVALGTLVADIGTALRRGDAPDAVLALIERRLDHKLAALARGPAAAVGGPPAVDPVERGQPLGVSHAALLQDPTTIGQGWNRLVVRYLDGRLLKGFSQDFHSSRPHFHLSPTVDGVTQQPVVVPMPRLKAVFFVKDFSGDADHVERKSFLEPVPGRRIEITFLDDEILIGATLGYRPDGAGFFVTPADPSGNNLRIFVMPGAIRHIRYL